MPRPDSARAEAAGAAEREPAGDLLRKSDAALRRAQRLAQIGSWHWEVIPDITTWSDELYRIFGLDPTRLPPSCTQQKDIYTAQSWAVLQPAIARTREHGDPYTLELEFVRPDGATGWMEARGAADRDEHGAIVGLHGTAREITGRKQAQAQADPGQRLDQDEGGAEGERRRLADVFRQAPAFLSVVRGPDHVFEMVNARYQQLVGHRHLLGRPVREAFPEIEGQGFFELLDTVYATGEPYIGTGVPIRFAPQPGQPPEERHLDFVYQPLRDPDQAITGIVAVGVDVTDRKRADGALQASEARYRALFESLDEGYCVIELLFDAAGESRDYRFLDVNPAFETITGITGAMGRTIRALLPGLESHWFETYSRIARTGEPVRIVEKAGPFQDRWFEVHAFRLGESGSNKLAVKFIDVTGRKLAEQAVQASDARHTFLVKLADTLRPLSDPNAVQAEASRVLGEWLGANRVAYFEIRGDDYVVYRDYSSGGTSIIGCVPTSSFGPDLRAALLAGRVVVEPDVNAALAQPATAQAAYLSIQVRAYVAVPLIKRGKMVAGLAVHATSPRAWTPTEVAMIEDTAQRTWDAVERVRSEAALRTSEERFRSLATATTQIVWTTAADGVVTDDSPTWRAFTGQTVEQWLGWGWMSAIHPDDQEAIRTSWRQALATVSPLKASYRLRRHDGEYRWTAVNGVPVMDEGGGLREWVGTNTDTQEQVQTAQRLRQLAADLSEADRRKDEFLATLAHELRNPLAPLRNSLELMRRADGNAGLLERARAMAERQVAQMVRLIDDLLDVSRITTDKLTLSLERIELASVLHQAVETCQPHLDRETQPLRIVLPPVPVHLHADPVRLAQVFGNLLNNASKFTPAGGGIELTAEVQGEEVAVTVRDTGIGIPADMLSKVFGLFTQIETSRKFSKGGLGIGLALAKRLTEMHGGTVSASSEGRDQGSEFVVRLPIVQEARDPAPTVGVADATSAGAARRILVVDDSRDTAESLSALLALYGHKTLMAHDGLDAVEKAASFRPEVILLDIGLPDLDGYETCRRIRHQPQSKNIVIIALTGWGQASDRRKSTDAGFDSHWVKPVDPAVLLELLSRLRTTAPPTPPPSVPAP